MNWLYWVRWDYLRIQKKLLGYNILVFILIILLTEISLITFPQLGPAHQNLGLRNVTQVSGVLPLGLVFPPNSI